MEKQRARESFPGPFAHRGSGQTTSGAGNYAVHHLAGLGRLRVRGGRAPRRGRASNCSHYDRDVLRRGETLDRRRRGRGAREVRTLLVSSVLLFVGRDVAKVRLHRGDVRLVLGVGELRNRNRGKNADDDDYDQKLNECKTLSAAHHIKSLRREAVGKKRCQPYGADRVKTTGRL